MWHTREGRSECEKYLLFSVLLSSLELSDAKVYEPQIRALLGTASHFCEAVVLKLRTVKNIGPSDWIRAPGWFVASIRQGSAGSYLRLTDSCITQLKAQGPSKTCNESKEEGRFGVSVRARIARGKTDRVRIDQIGRDDYQSRPFCTKN